MLSRVRTRFHLLRRLPVQAYYTLSGWRFDDLKEHIDRSGTTDHDAVLAIADLNEVLFSASAGEQVGTAIITCLPPDASGIAGYSLRHILASDEPMDIFSPVRDVSQFLRNIALIHKVSGGRSRLRPISSLLALNEVRAYRTMVFVVGNSDHNIEVYRAMEAVSRLQGGDRSICYLHDPCCHNVVQSAKKLNSDRYLDHLEKLYGVRLGSGRGFEKWLVHQKAVNVGVMGVRAIADSGVKKFLVNSLTAAEIVRDDLSTDQRADTQVTKLFHPVFPLELGVKEASRRWRDAGRTYVVGTFGGAGYSKRTEVVIEAVSKLRARGEDVELRVAGYDAHRFIDSYFQGRRPEWIYSSEPETEHELQFEMAQCSIAVQLRKESLGESSGVVPTLIALRVPTIVSPIGSFCEYEGAVLYFSGGSEDLERLLSSRPQVADDLMSAYANKYSLAMFVRSFSRAASFGPEAASMADKARA